MTTINYINAKQHIFHLLQFFKILQLLKLFVIKAYFPQTHIAYHKTAFDALLDFSDHNIVCYVTKINDFSFRILICNLLLLCYNKFNFYFAWCHFSNIRAWKSFGFWKLEFRFWIIVGGINLEFLQILSINIWISTIFKFFRRYDLKETWQQ